MQAENEQFDLKSNFATIINSVRCGDELASAELFQYFQSRLLILIKCRISPRFRVKFDEDDVLQSVFRSFFVRHRRGDFYLESYDNLWSVLLVIARRKICRRVVHSTAARRSCDREQSLEALDKQSVAELCIQSEAIKLTEIQELLDQLYRTLNSREQAVLELHLALYSYNEISEQLQLSERTIRRCIQRIRCNLEQIWEKV